MKRKLILTENIGEDWDKLKQAGLTSVEIKKIFNIRFKLERPGIIDVKKYPVFNHNSISE